MLINKALKDYVYLLCLYWPHIEQLTCTDSIGSFKDDWLQANWEIIVERQLMSADMYLEAYGDGAGCNGESSRVLFPEKIATHSIILNSNSEHKVYDILGERYIENKDDDIIFQKFVTIKKDGWYYEEPPFNKIEALYRDETIIVDFSIVYAKLKAI